jgi:hypothetical protein
VYQNPGESHRRLSLAGIAAHSAEIHPRPRSGVAAPAGPWALAALILALFGLATYLAAPIGAVLGHVALRRINRAGTRGRTTARSAIIVGWSITGTYSLVLVIALLWTGGLQIGS